MIYGESSYNGFPYRHPFVTLHNVHYLGENPELGPGQLVTPDILVKLLSGLGHQAPVELLPENVLVRADDHIVWWTPASIRTLFFADRAGDAALRHMSGKRYPQPALIFKVRGKMLWVRAMLDSVRPNAATQMYMAPYWNCYANGAVCTGTMMIPPVKQASQVVQWENSFFDSEFAHAAGNNKACRHPDGVLAMNQALRGKKVFPPGYLVKVKQTLQQFVENNDARFENTFPIA